MKYIKERHCDMCNKKQNFIYEEVNTDYNVKGELINVNILTSKCSGCGEEIWDDEIIRHNEDIVFSEYRRLKNLVFPEEIKEIRKKYNISQRDLALLLGFGEKTLSRYENCALPDESHNLILMLIKNEDSFKSVYENNKNKLSMQVRNELEKILYPNNNTKSK